MFRFILLLLLAALALFSYSGGSLESRVKKANEKYMQRSPFDAIIVPGYPYREQKNAVLFNVRIHFAKELFEKGIAKNIIFSGGAAHTPYIEGRIMKTIADSLGIPPKHTFEEDEAMHSNQNTINGTRLAHKLGFRNIAVATDPYQFSYMTLLVKFYTPQTAIISFAPDKMPYYNMPLPDVDTTSSFVRNFVPVD